MNVNHQFRTGKVHRLMWIGIVLLSTVAALGYWHFSKDSEVPTATPIPDRTVVDPRVAYNGPFQNIHPSVRYVGSQVCAECHAKIDHQFHQHPMGRSLLPMSKVVDQLTYTKESRNPFEAFGREMTVIRNKDRMWHRESQFDSEGKKIYDHLLEVHYVVGSGNSGHSFLTNRDGFIFQTPISYFPQKKNLGHLTRVFPCNGFRVGRFRQIVCSAMPIVLRLAKVP